MRIDGIDTADALCLTGVVAVITYKNIPGKNIVPIVFDDQPLLAETEARFIGEPIAIVVAESQRLASKAAALVKVSYTELPAVTNPLIAMADGASVVNPVLGNIVARHKISESEKVVKTVTIPVVSLVRA